MDLIWRGFRHIAPHGDVWNKEPFAEWYARVKDEIPHVPACVAESWIHRHWGYSPYYWLPLARLRFEKQSWTNSEILRIGEGLADRDRPFSPEWSDEFGHEKSYARESWLGRYMLEHRTWPAPIIVLDNTRRRVRDRRWITPLARFHLIEGHRRSAYHHYLATHGLALDAHEVWLVTIAPRVK